MNFLCHLFCSAPPPSLIEPRQNSSHPTRPHTPPPPLDILSRDKIRNKLVLSFPPPNGTRKEEGNRKMTTPAERKNQQVWDSIEAGAFKQALQLCNRRLKKGEKGDYLLVS